jgi:hypothetical protein
MNANYSAGKISFDFDDVLGCMSDSEKLELIESLSCDGKIIEFVSQQIIDKWTESGFYSGVSCVATADACNGLDKAWRAVAKASGDVAKREIERLEDALRFEKKQTQSAWDEWQKLRNRREYV